MPAAALPLPYLDEIITENKIELFRQRHGRLHIGKKILQSWHFFYSAPCYILL
jgi:hypothetical protein